jgi:hypothetical protein
MGLRIWIAKFVGPHERCDSAEFRAYFVFELVYENGDSREMSTADLDEFASRDGLATSFCPVID